MIVRMRSRFRFLCLIFMEVLSLCLCLFRFILVGRPFRMWMIYIAISLFRNRLFILLSIKYNLKAISVMLLVVFWSRFLGIFYKITCFIKFANFWLFFIGFRILCGELDQILIISVELKMLNWLCLLFRRCCHMTIRE